MARSIVLALLAALGSSGPLGSCYGVENRMTLMPDGTGKVEVLISQKPEDEKDLKKPFDLLEFVESSTGVAAFSPAKTEIKDGWRHSRFTAYFDDVNKVYYNADGPGREERDLHDECLHFKLERQGEGFILTMEDWIFNRGPGRGDPTEKWEQVREESANVVAWSFNLFGKVAKTDGFQRVEGRQAVYERSPKTILKLEDAVKWPVCARRRIEFGKSELAETDIVAFRAELATAKAAWPKIREDLEAARRKAEAEKK